ncbi:PREDICTED: prominin-1-like [Priapulus caudatus]|uniref:Prominin-1-like n=1 Tax=Priapulus caudatus TaxID=37621 RepID=A0ABM1EQR1_PRICU|nr:PREDICTED: prominin-1-like [Priapulus caudatus]
MGLVGPAQSDTRSVSSNVTIPWAGELPQPKPYITYNNYEPGGLKGLYTMARGWAGLVSKELQSDMILDYAETYDDYDAQEIIYESIAFSIGIVICVVIGILFCVAMPISGIFFCCCRCCGCGCCGGNETQTTKEAEGGGRACLQVTVFCTLALLLSGGVCLAINNERIKDVWNDVETSIDTNFDDLRELFDVTVKQLEYTGKDDFRLMMKMITDDIDDIANVLGKPVVDDISAIADLDASIDSVMKLGAEVDKVAEDVGVFVTTLDRMQSTVETFSLELTALEQNLTTACSGGLCPGLEPDSVVIEVDYSQVLVQLKDLLDQINEVQTMNLTKLAIEASDAINNIPDEIYTATEQSREDIKTTLNDTEAEMVEELDDLIEAINEYAITDELKQEWLDAVSSDEANIAEQARWWTWMALAIVVFIIVVCLALGMTCGIVGYSKNDHPTLRSNTSHCGGNCLLCGVVLCFIFASLLMFCCTVFFVVGSPTETYICEPLADPELEFVAELVDVPGTPLMTDLKDDEYMLSYLVYDDGSIVLRITDVLKECRDNRAIWDVIKLDNVYDLNDLPDPSEMVDIDELVKAVTDEIDLTTVSILTPELKEQLEKFNEVLSKLDTTAYEILLEPRYHIGTKSPALLMEIDDCSGRPQSPRRAADSLRIPALALTVICETTSYATALEADTETALITPHILIPTHSPHTRRTLPNASWFCLGWCAVMLIPTVIFATKLAKYYKRTPVFDDRESLLPQAGAGPHNSSPEQRPSSFVNPTYTGPKAVPAHPLHKGVPNNYSPPPYQDTPTSNQPGPVYYGGHPAYTPNPYEDGFSLAVQAGGGYVPTAPPQSMGGAYSGHYAPQGHATPSAYDAFDSIPDGLPGDTYESKPRRWEPPSYAVPVIPGLPPPNTRGMQTLY